MHIPRYRKKVNRNSYSSITLNRNGKKQPYLTTAIKRAYYEAGRQEAEENLIDSDTTTEWVAPKLNQLPRFIDVFAGTGTVAASVGANKSVVNDIDVGVACFYILCRMILKRFVKDLFSYIIIL